MVALKEIDLISTDVSTGVADVLMQSRTCSKCGEHKPASGFRRDKNRKSSLYPTCKACLSRYYFRNRERILKQCSEYRALNAQKLAAKSREYASRRFFYKRAERLISPGGGVSASDKCAEISRLWKKQRGVCALSGRRLNRDNAEIDHIIPKTRGGSCHIDNLRWVHRDVNRAKRNLLDSEFFALCQEVIARIRESV